MLAGNWFKRRKKSIGIGVSIDTTSIPFRYPFFKSTADTDPILSIAIGDTIGTDSATDINNPGNGFAKKYNFLNIISNQDSILKKGPFCWVGWDS